MDFVDAPLMTPDTVEREYNFPRRRLAKMRCAGEGPAYLKIGRSVFYRRSDIEAFLASCRKGG